MTSQTQTVEALVTPELVAKTARSSTIADRNAHEFHCEIGNRK